MEMFAPRHTRGRDLLVVLAIYAVALVAERLDREVFAASGCIGPQLQACSGRSCCRLGNSHAALAQPGCGCVRTVRVTGPRSRHRLVSARQIGRPDIDNREPTTGAKT